MADFLRRYGVTEDGIGGPALALVIAVLGCLMIFTTVRARTGSANLRRFLPFYLAAIALALVTMWLELRFFEAGSFASLVLAAVYLGLIYGLVSLILARTPDPGPSQTGPD